MTEMARASLDPAKFRDPARTAEGKPRARVAFRTLKTLWFNTGTLCNLTCENCYIESSPRNDRLVYLSAEEVARFLDELGSNGWRTEEIGFTGGEPLMNPDIIAMLEDSLQRGYRTLVLTNAMRPMMKQARALRDLHRRFARKLVLRVSVDHYTPELHEAERGPRSWKPMLAGLTWLAEHGFTIHVAGRTRWNEDETRLREGYARFFAANGIALDAQDCAQLVLFPEMDEKADVPEITESCWEILNVERDSMMCATSRMVVKRKGEERPVVMPCTLLPYDKRFEMAETLADATHEVALNHPHCARFCVLGGGACSVTAE